MIFLKMTKNKIVISILTIALIGTSSVAGVKMSKIKDHDRGVYTNMDAVTQEKKDMSVTDETNTSLHGNASNTKKTVTANLTNNGTIKNNSATDSSTPTTTEVSPRELALDKTISDSKGNTLTFKTAKIDNNIIRISVYLHINEKNCLDGTGCYCVDATNIIFKSNSGSIMQCPSNYKYSPDITAHSYQGKSNDGHTTVILGYDPSITSITVFYTFEDGTQASTVLNLN